MAYLCVIATVLLAVYGSLIAKWRISQHGDLPPAFPDNALYLLRMFLDPYILSACIAALLAAFLWMAALSKLDLSKAYPFVSLSFALVLIFSTVIFHEPLNIWKIGGVTLIIAGILLGSQG